MATYPPTDGTVLVTGASSGIGRALARRIAPEARRLILVARRAELLEDLADELRQGHRALRVDVRPCDLTDLGQTEGMIDDVLADGPIDVLVNNAGLGDRAFFEDGRWPKLERLIALNVVAVTYLTRRVLPGMVERGRGGVLNIGSIAGVLPVAGAATYCATKHYVAGLSEALRAEVAGTGVVVTEVRPGPVPTEFQAASENALGIRAPAPLQISAAACAREALAGFRRGRAVVMPGLLNRWLIRLSGLLPAALRRWALARWARRVRAQAQARRSPVRTHHESE